MIPLKLKVPQRPEQLVLLKLLKGRTNLPEKYLRQIQRLTSGYEGEIQFFNRLKETVHNSALIVNNLTLMYENSQIQIDSLLIVENNIYLFEVKNYQGDFFIEGEDWFTAANNNEISNPLTQLNRTRFLLEKILRSNNFNFNIYTYLIFINEEFTLYHAKMNNHVILPTQIARFLRHLKKHSFKRTQFHYNLLKFFEKNHVNSTKQIDRPKYTFEQLKKGIYCWYCRHQLVRQTQRTMRCTLCQTTYKNNLAIINNIEEFKILFPEEKVTTDFIIEWCGNMFPRKTIKGFMNKVYKKLGSIKKPYYITEENHKYYQNLIKQVNNPLINKNNKF